MLHQEADQETILLNNDTTKNKIVFFYRDDCSAGQHVFGTVYLHQLIWHNLLLVNLTQPNNRGYIQKYQLKSVPTLMVNNHKLANLADHSISQLLNQATQLLTKGG